mgnify:FL=1
MAKSTEWWRKYFEEFPSDVLQDLVISDEEHSVLINEILINRGVIPNKLDKHEYDWKRHYASLETTELSSLPLPEDRKPFVKNILHERSVRILKLENQREELGVDWNSIGFSIFIVVVISPFILAFIFAWSLGWPIALYHLVLVVTLGVALSRNAGTSVSDMGTQGNYVFWILLILIDFPVSIFIILLWRLLNKATDSDLLKSSWIPVCLFGVIGTLWWFMMPMYFAGIL